MTDSGAAGLLPGDGLVLYERGLALVCADTTNPVVDRLLEAVQEVATARWDGRALVRRVAQILTSVLPADPPSCGVAGPVGGGAAVLVSGAALARVVMEAGTEIALDAGTALTWTDRLIEEPVTRLDLTLPGAGDPDPRLRLASGVVRGGGLSHTHPAPPERTRVRRPDVPFEAELLTPDRTAPDAVPLPPPPEPAPAPEVIGVHCKDDHFNDPSAPYCAVCGISMAQRTLMPLKGPRPPLGVLLVDDGVTIRLDADYLIGRDPEPAPEVASGQARPLRLVDQDGSVSRRHARVFLDGWEVKLVDLASVNGVRVKGRDQANYQRLQPNTPVTLTPGTTVLIGASRTIRYESHRA